MEGNPHIRENNIENKIAEEMTIQMYKSAINRYLVAPVASPIYVRSPPGFDPIEQMEKMEELQKELADTTRSNRQLLMLVEDQRSELKMVRKRQVEQEKKNYLLRSQLKFQEMASQMQTEQMISQLQFLAEDFSIPSCSEIIDTLGVCDSSSSEEYDLRSPEEYGLRSPEEYGLRSPEEYDLRSSGETSLNVRKKSLNVRKLKKKPKKSKTLKRSMMKRETDDHTPKSG